MRAPWGWCGAEPETEGPILVADRHVPDSPDSPRRRTVFGRAAVPGADQSGCRPWRRGSDSGYWRPLWLPCRGQHGGRSRRDLGRAVDVVDGRLVEVIQYVARVGERQAVERVDHVTGLEPQSRRGRAGGGRGVEPQPEGAVAIMDRRVPDSQIPGGVPRRGGGHNAGNDRSYSRSRRAEAARTSRTRGAARRRGARQQIVAGRFID